MTVTSDYAIVGRIIESLRRFGSWCGETHIQKGGYLAKAVFGVPLSVDFVLYKHGPYSFDLTSLLTSMRADQLIKLVPQGQHYGPSFDLDDRIQSIMERYQNEIGRVELEIDKVAAFLGPKNVADLERVATAIYVWEKDRTASQEAKAEELHRLKPHISMLGAIAAVNEADLFLRDSGII